MKVFNKYFFGGLVAGLFLTIIILIVGGYIFIRSFTPQSSAPKTRGSLESMLQPPPFPTRTKMDYNWRVQGLDGRELHFSQIKGKLIFLNFWGTWCPPCVAEMPSIQRLYDRVKGEGIQFMCVSDEDKTKVRKFVEERGFTFPVYTLLGEKPRVLETRGVPATFIISRDGQIVFKHVGAAQWDHETGVDFIKRLL
jgi:thiol-disulfide isomerase/thioredoxin